MVLVKPSFEIEGALYGADMLQALERYGRTCYKSESCIDVMTASKFVRMLINRGHDSVLEHESITVRIVCDRGVSHELVRHRLAAYSQESTRYCDYKGGVTFVIPPWCNWADREYDINDMRLYWDDSMSPEHKASQLWFSGCFASEKAYQNLLSLGWSPQQARSVLPNSLKTEIVITQNIRQWRHWFRLRALGESGKPHPQMLEIAVPMLKEFQKQFPVLFEDLEVSV